MKKIFLISLMLILILACGGKGGSSKGKKFIINVSEEPQSIDPQLSTDIVGSTVNELISEGLLRRNADGKPTAGLAENGNRLLTV